MGIGRPGGLFASETKSFSGVAILSVLAFFGRFRKTHIESHDCRIYGASSITVAFSSDTVGLRRIE
jgi:hypothetical protein